MKKYTVAITEIIEYLVPVEAANEQEAESAGLAKFMHSGDPNEYAVSIQSREVEGVNEA